MSDSLKYYKDRCAKNDTERHPGDRVGEKCLNCDRSHDYHYGWACNERDESRVFYDIPWDQRYVTVSMRKSRGLMLKGKYAYKYANSSSTTSTVTMTEEGRVDVSDWRVWAYDYTNPDHCKCGRPRKGCEYHDPSMQKCR